MLSTSSSPSTPSLVSRSALLLLHLIIIRLEDRVYEFGRLAPWERARQKKMCSTIESLTDKLICNVIVLLPFHLCSESQSDHCKRRHMTSVALIPFRITQRCITKVVLRIRGGIPKAMEQTCLLARKVFFGKLSRSRVEKSRPLHTTTDRSRELHFPPSPGAQKKKKRRFRTAVLKPRRE